jgi:hypothetical protein
MISAGFDGGPIQGQERVPTITVEENLGIVRLYEFFQTVDWKKLYETLA